MYALLLSLISSLLVGFYFKSLKISNIKNIYIVIFTNYIVAIITCYLLFNESLNVFTVKKSISIITLLLGILIPTIFFILIKSLIRFGLFITVIFLRISIFVTVTHSFCLVHL